MEPNSRRKFIKGAALTGIATFCLSSAESFAAVTQTQIKTLKNGAVILFQGDSITDGNRGRNTDPNHIMGHGYAFSIASRVGADYPEKRYQFYNRGISGNKVNDLEERWQAETLDLKPDVLSILVGVNDSGSVVFKRDPVIPIEKYEEIYTSLLVQTKAAFPNILFVLCEPFILKGGSVTENWEAYHSDIVKRQAIVRKLATKFDAVFVGFQEVFEKACDKATAGYWIWDGVHPTVAGHELMAREWLKQVGKRIRF
ncbi:MAG: SGNH/GDSL hydrolase family protein [Prolixibacteraceae bacterium]|nr:SGNH/GDSL hydrolase family protein [Prolixibacteraceae bacterium]